MKKYSQFLIFCGIFLFRFATYPDPIPPSWTPDSIVKFTAPILEEPRHTESQTIIEIGVWRIKLKGYQNLDIGQYYSFAGKATPRLLLGKVRQIEVMDPTFDVVGNQKVGGWGRVLAMLSRVRQAVVKTYQKSLPEPHASLAAGILLGVKQTMPYEFYQSLIKTGTVHIIAASGYNVTIAARTVMVPLMMVLSKPTAIAFGVIAIGLYVIVAGGSAAVVRAGIMASLTLMAYYLGRRAESKRLLWVTAAAMLLIQPLMLVDVGFQLSVAATLGLLYLEPWIRGKFENRNQKNETNSKCEIRKGLKNFLNEFWWPTVAASIATAPIIFLTFGRLSLISPLVNLFVLPLTPVIMFLSAVAVGVAWVPVAKQLAMWLLYVPLEFFVQVIQWWG